MSKAGTWRQPIASGSCCGFIPSVGVAGFGHRARGQYQRSRQQQQAGIARVAKALHGKQPVDTKCGACHNVARDDSTEIEGYLSHMDARNDATLGLFSHISRDNTCNDALGSHNRKADRLGIT